MDILISPGLVCIVAVSIPDGTAFIKLAFMLIIKPVAPGGTAATVAFVYVAITTSVLRAKYPTFAVHCPAPARDLLFAGHAPHASAELAPAVPEKVPAAHAVHVADVSWPVWFEYVPVGHAEQEADVLRPGVPENVPAGQGVQALPLLRPVETE